MKNNGGDEAIRDDPRYQNVQNEKIRKYARFFRRFGKKKKGDKSINGIIMRKPSLKKLK